MQSKSFQETMLYGEDIVTSSSKQPKTPQATTSAQRKGVALKEARDIRDVTWLEVDESWYVSPDDVAPKVSTAAATEERLRSLAAGVSGDRSVTVSELPFELPSQPVAHVSLGQAVVAEQKQALAEVPTDASLSGRSTVLPAVKSEGAKIRISSEGKIRYEALSPLGSGAAGDVLLAQDNDIDRKVALKKLKKQRHTPPNLRRFVDEIRMMGTLEHPNIVPIHDVGLDEEGQYYFVMKYIEGQTMADVIDKLVAGDEETHARFPYEVRHQIFLKILQAVEFAHSQGVIHRDLKPSNIMIGPYGEVMVVDWGLAKQIRDAMPENDASEQAPSDPNQPMTVRADGRPRRWFETRHDTLLGTPAYMSPEQALGHNQEVDERSDIYSLSIIYYEWLGLRHYMSHKDTLQELLFGIVSEEPTLLALIKHDAQPPIPVEFCHFARRGMHKSPGNRFASVKAMREDLQRALAGKFAIECPITFNRRLTNEWLRATSRFPLLSLAAVFSVLGFFFFGCFAAISSMIAGT